MTPHSRYRALVATRAAVRSPGPQGPYDQSPVEQRSDVLVYSSLPLPNTTPR